jgi:hypothetical protein
MSDTAIASEMQSITRNAAGPWQPGDSVKAAIGRAARTLGIGYRRARSFWYGESVAIRATEADRMRAAERALLAERERYLTHELTIIKARRDAADEAAAVGAAVLARHVGGKGGTGPDLAQRETDRDGETAGTRVRPWDALRDADRRRL